MIAVCLIFNMRQLLHGILVLLSARWSAPSFIRIVRVVAFLLVLNSHVLSTGFFLLHSHLVFVNQIFPVNFILIALSLVLLKLGQ